MYRLAGLSLCFIAFLTIAGGADPSDDGRGDEFDDVDDTNEGITELSVNAITIELRNARPHYRLPDIDRNFTRNQLVEFLLPYYKAIPTEDRKPDIILGPTPKMKFDPMVITMLRQIKRQCGVTVVRMPPMTGRDPHAHLRAYANATLGKRNISE